MEKICTRCSFRNPGGRGVCQVCGYSKFVPMADAQLVVAKETASVVNETAIANGESFGDTLRQTKVAVVNALYKIKALVTNKPVALQQEVVAESKTLKFADAKSSAGSNVVFEDNDLDSMIAWFKSYGVDRPLILEPAPAPVVVRQNNSRAA